jgi:hypothetical protein
MQNQKKILAYTPKHILFFKNLPLVLLLFFLKKESLRLGREGFVLNGCSKIIYCFTNLPIAISQLLSQTNFTI